MAADATPEIDHHPIPFLFDLALLHLFSASVYVFEKVLSIGEFIYIWGKILLFLCGFLLITASGISMNRPL